MNCNRCALCNIEINKYNNTKEHIIPNSIGGRRKVKNFICNFCNRKSGDKWEAELAKQLNPLSLFFKINRERGKVPSEVFDTVSGKRYKLNYDGSMNLSKPQKTEIKTESNVKINISTRNKKEAVQMLNGIKRTYSNLDTKKVLSNMTLNESYCKEPINFKLSIGGHEFGRSIVKSSLSLAVDSGISLDVCNIATGYLRDENTEACFGYYYEKDIILNRPEGIPLHCVSISGNSSNNLLLGYVEYFGIYKMVICLSDMYFGEDFNNTYAINPMTSKELSLNIDINFSMNDIKSIYNYEKIPQDSMKNALVKVMSTGIKKSSDDEMHRVIENAVTYAWSKLNLKEGDILDNDTLNKLNGYILEKMQPFILKNISKKR